MMWMLALAAIAVIEWVDMSTSFEWLLEAQIVWGVYAFILYKRGLLSVSIEPYCM